MLGEDARQQRLIAGQAAGDHPDLAEGVSAVVHQTEDVLCDERHLVHRTGHGHNTTWLAGPCRAVTGLSDRRSSGWFTGLVITPAHPDGLFTRPALSRPRPALSQGRALIFITPAHPGGLFTRPAPSRPRPALSQGRALPFITPAHPGAPRRALLEAEDVALE